ncbi:EVE domain-containing protein [Methanoregula sp.]|uniref:EVE domain-containing protein n=1 Tax=Methanoregula sp. TaxID=2052170 RepID=UPI002B5579A5|nr:EVE domain-containing protein [Methanoregula sp.]HVP96755.1 EVE domain-containing protein [Methanoregula sp.]
MISKYYLAIFNVTSWREFLNNGARIYGTTGNQANRAKNLQKGDFLICYITGYSEFVGILEILSDAYVDKSRLWEESTFPIRFDVKLVEKLSEHSGISGRDLVGKLSVLKNLKNPKKWWAFFINSLNEFPSDDGEYLVNAIRMKAASKRDFSSKQTWKR